jgi:RNA ligase-like protein
MMEFREFGKIARLSRDIVITEKIDGTNGLIAISDDGSEFRVGSRSRWITPEDDNFGFAAWAMEHRGELEALGPGYHYGEWWGKGIQRNYSQTVRRFSLFNVHRWGEPFARPACCDIVPVLYEGLMEEYGVMKGVKIALAKLQEEGSFAAPGFMNPEGIVIYHKASNTLLKKTLEKDEAPKGKT